MSTIIVLGAGMVGSTIAIDMAKKHSVSITDFNEKALEKAISKCDKLIPIQLDVTNKKELQKTIKSFDLVICAVPGFLGFETLKSIIEAEKNVVDISFFSENSLELDTLAKKHNVIDANKEIKYFDDYESFFRTVSTHRANALLDPSKIMNYYKLSDIHESIETSLKTWIR